MNPFYEIAPFGSTEEIQVKGSYYYQDAFNAMFMNERGTDNNSFTINVTLVPEPDNPHDTSGAAVSVRWHDYVIGYLPSEESERFAQLRRITASGYDPRAEARVSSNIDINEQRQVRISLNLPSPEVLIPANNPPAEKFILLPPGTRVQVTKENQHSATLANYLPPRGTGQILVSLHLATIGVRTQRQVVEIRLDDQPIGELSKVSSEKFAPIVSHFSQFGTTCIARAIIKGSSLASEVEIFAARANELSEEFLAGNQVQPLPRLIPYEADPRNYAAPPRYQSLQAPYNHVQPAQASYVQNPPPARQQVEVINTPLLWTLWACFGIVGGHRYYLGNIGVGILQTLTAGGFGVWWIVDAFMLNKRAREVNSGLVPRIKF